MKHLNAALFATLMASSLSLTACATKQDRRGPPQDRQGAGQDGERRGAEGRAKSSGTFMVPTSALFTAMDSNNDKSTSLAEMQAGTQSEWAGFDRNPSAIYFSDWSLENLGSTDAMPTFMSFDRDFSGVISESEFSQQIEQEFKRLDKNNDGRLTRSEMIIAFAAPRAQQPRKSGSKEKSGKGGKGGGRQPR